MSVGDWASLATCAMFVLAFGGFVLTRLREGKKAIQVEAIAKALATQRQGSLEHDVGRLTENVDGLGHQLVKHRLEFANFKGENESQHAAVRDTLLRLDRSISDLQSQLRMLMTGGADQIIKMERSRDGKAASDGQG